MPRDSNGVYSLPAAYLATTGETIEANQHNTPLEDIRDALTLSLPRNGAAPMTGDLKMGGFKATNLGDPTADTDALNRQAGDSRYLGAKQGANIASAATVNLGAATGPYVQITGTTTITSFGTANAGVIRFVEFAGALTLTHNAVSLILPTGANITTAAGDVFYFESKGGGNWKCIGYVLASGFALAAQPLHGQCQIKKSGSNLLLSPYNGNKLVINGKQEIIPSAGVTLAPTGLIGGTIYNIYAYMNSGTMTLEASSTATAVDSATGVTIKSGSATRTFVGTARINGSIAWENNVNSWFNRDLTSLTARAWAFVTESGGVYTIAASYNISGVTRYSTGYVGIGFLTSMASSNYAVAGSSGVGSGYTVNADARGPSGMSIYIRNGGNTLADNAFSIIVFGD